VNVTCNKCSKKYVIADDKVAGKASVKIRCKQCQNLITVAVTGVGATAGVGMSSSPSGVTSSPSGLVSAVAPAAAPAPLQQWEEERTRAMPPLDLTATWYAMIAGKQQGPFDIATLQRRVTAGEVTLRTYLWKPGMGDWKRASDVPEVSPVFAGVSVGATATGPTQASAEAQRPVSRTNNPSVKRDVAVANEVPVDGEVLAPRKKATTVVYGSDESKAAAAQARAAFENQPAAAPAATNGAPLNDLFNDLGTGTTNQALEPVKSSPTPEPTPGDGGGDGSVAAEASTSGTIDPFAQLAGPVKEGEAPPPGEATKFFIAKAGVNKRNPPWKIALFVFGGVGIPVAIGWVLTTFNVVQLPTVTRTTDDGQEVQESFFSPGGFGGLKDALTGDARRKKDDAERQKKQREAMLARAAAQRNNGGSAGTGTTGTEPTGEDPVPPPTRPQNPDLAALYGDDTRTIKGPKVRKDDGDPSPGSQVNTSGLSQDAAMKIVADKSKAFQTCVETALHRNPSLAVGNITIVLNVGRSGAVTGAEVLPDKHRDADWAKCMVSSAKRIVFPSSDGDTQLEVPFKVGVALSP
jgi:predicted Zn finger-like uncharacterized protein